MIDINRDIENSKRKEKSTSLLGRSSMEKKSCVFIDKWLRRVRGHCASLYHPNNSISLRESFRFQTTPTGFGYGHICQDFSSVSAKHRIVHSLLALSLSFPSLLLLPYRSPSVEWSHPQADGDRQCSPGRKLIGKDWERIWRWWIALTWWENQCTLPVYLHHAELRDHCLMLSLLGVIKSFVSTLISLCNHPAQADQCTAACTVPLLFSFTLSIVVLASNELVYIREKTGTEIVVYPINCRCAYQQTLLPWLALNICTNNIHKVSIKKLCM